MGTGANDVIVPASALVLMLLAWRSGLTPSEVGVAGGRMRSGLRLGLLVAATIASVVLVVGFAPPTQHFFADSRYPSPRAAFVAAAATIPLTTALPEELLFRGALHGCLTRVFGARGQYLLGATAFGAWHVLALSSLSGSNAGLGDLVGHSVFGQVLGVGAVLTATSVAGLAFVWLRRRSGSLLAPVLAHWAIDGCAALVVGLHLL